MHIPRVYGTHYTLHRESIMELLTGVHQSSSSSLLFLAVEFIFCSWLTGVSYVEWSRALDVRSTRKKKRN